jgi:pseudouridine synthase
MPLATLKEPIAGLQSSSIFLVHKPVDVVCSKEDEAKDVIVRGVPRPTRQTMFELAEAQGFPAHFNLVGRLDAETSGLILFTNNKVLMNAINHPIRPDCPDKSSILPFKEKEYSVTLRPGKTILNKWRREGSDSFDPSALEEEISRPFEFDYKGEHFVCGRSIAKVIRRYNDSKYSYGREDVIGWCIDMRVIIAEGKHHQIRRMAKMCGYKVSTLTRIRIAGILSIESLPDPGTCRWLTREEELLLMNGLRVADRGSGMQASAAAEAMEGVEKAPTE